MFRIAATFVLAIAIGMFALPASSAAAAETTVAPSPTTHTTCDASSKKGGPRASSRPWSRPL